MQTDLAVSPSGDVWVMNNWQDIDSCFAAQLPVVLIDRKMSIMENRPPFEGGRRAALFTCAPGKEVASPNAYNGELAGLYGEAVATIHSAADSFEGRHASPCP